MVVVALCHHRDQQTRPTPAKCRERYSPLQAQGPVADAMPQPPLRQTPYQARADSTVTRPVESWVRIPRPQPPGEDVRRPLPSAGTVSAAPYGVRDDSDEDR